MLRNPGPSSLASNERLGARETRRNAGVTASVYRGRMLRAPADPRVRRFLLAALAIYVLALVLIAFWPTHVDRDAGPLLAAIERLFPWATYRRLEFTANIALFVPFGLLLTLLVRSWPLALGLGVGASLAIEVVQELALPGRTASVLDVLANSLGTAAGGLLALAIAWMLHPASAPRRAGVSRLE